MASTVFFSTKYICRVFAWIQIHEKFNTGKAIIVVGCRQVGKITLLKKSKDKDYLFLDTDDPSTISILQSPTK
jgi:uncharacterized protein